jgi:SnoaL-like domain
MAERDGVLFANESFYRAFAGGDPAMMDDLWSRKAPVACIHPGWAPLGDRHSVVESWRRILAQPNRPAIECVLPEAYLLGDVAMVICYEKIGDNYLIATNLFRREGQNWKMVHHQAGPVAEPPDMPTPDDAAVH